MKRKSSISTTGHSNGIDQQKNRRQKQLPCITTWEAFFARYGPLFRFGPEATVANWQALGYTPQQATLFAEAYRQFLTQPSAYRPTTFVPVIYTAAQRFSEHFLQAPLAPPSDEELLAKLDAIEAQARSEGCTNYTPAELDKLIPIWSPSASTITTRLLVAGVSVAGVVAVKRTCRPKCAVCLGQRLRAWMEAARAS